VERGGRLSGFFAMSYKVENLQGGAVMSYTEIAEHMGVSRQEVQRLAQRGLKKLKRNQILREYYDALISENEVRCTDVANRHWHGDSRAG